MMQYFSNPRHQDNYLNKIVLVYNVLRLCIWPKKTKVAKKNVSALRWEHSSEIFQEMMQYFPIHESMKWKTKLPKKISLIVAE